MRLQTPGSVVNGEQGAQGVVGCRLTVGTTSDIQDTGASSGDGQTALSCPVDWLAGEMRP